MARSSPRKRATVNYSETNNGAGATLTDDDDSRPTRRIFDRVKEKVKAVVGKGKEKEKEKEKGKAVGTKRKAASQDENDYDDYDDEEKVKPAASKPAKKRKTAKVKDEDKMPLAERTAIASLGKAMYIGAHVSASGGVQNAVTNAVHIGANSFALFLKSQRKWDNPALTTESRDLFVSQCSHHGYSAASHALPHGSYLVNLAQRDPAKADQAYAGFLDDLRRCEQLGIRLYNFHPGNTGGEPRAEAIGRIAGQLNRAHGETEQVVTVLENMAGQGNVVGSTWEDLRDIIALVDDKSRVGVCIDTCHAFAAGHDLRTPEAFKETVDTFNKVVGAGYLKAFHLNDSKAPFSSHRDLHANIGTGFLGLRAFHNVMNHDAFRGMPMVLETPIDRKGPDGKPIEDKQVWADEIKLLESLIGMDPEGDEFKRLDEELQAKGAAERGRVQGQVDKKLVKDAKKGSRKKAVVTNGTGGGGRGKGKKKSKTESDDDDDDSE